jgi:hypothetical protein
MKFEYFFVEFVFEFCFFEKNKKIKQSQSAFPIALFKYKI